MKTKSPEQIISNNIDCEKKNGSIQEPITEASFENAITATGFGTFNIILLAISVPCAMSFMMDTTAMSYVVPAAHCDLNMSLEQRGLLNAITYLGMISSAFIWGFLADTLGRRKVLIAGYLLDGCFIILAGFAQTFEMLLIAKYFAGFIINGPFAALTTVLSEFHCAKYRTRILMCMGAIFSIAQVVIPGLAWLVIPTEMEYQLLDSNFKLHSWNFFILVCAIPSLLGSFLHIFMPESPKFLMTVGRNEDALRVFKKVYSLNTGLPPDTFPIKSLMDESKLNAGGKHGGLVTANRTKTQALKEGLQQIKPLFFPPLIWKLLLVSTIQCGFVLGANAVRLWLPQIFTAMNDYQMHHPDEKADLCTMLEIIKPKDGNVTDSECVVNKVADFVYINSMIVSTSAVIGYILVSFIINRLGKKRAMILFSTISGIATSCIYFAQNTAVTVLLAAMNHTFVGICTNLELTIAVDIFPTSLRVIAISLVMMVGRCGAVIGNVVFPFLMEVGCLPPFLFVGCIILSCSLLAIALPRTDLKALV